MIIFKYVVMSQFFSAFFIVNTVLIIHFYLNRSKRIKNYRNKRLGEERSKVRKVIFDKFSGVLLFGIIPGLIALFLYDNKLSFYGISSNYLLQSFWWIMGLTPVIIFLAYINSGKEKNLAVYPQIRKSKWSVNLLIASAFSWILYLVAYEFMFRGFLLFISESYIGFWPAVSVNVLIYSIAHIPKGIKETLGSVPFGILICVITLKTGNLLTPLVLHIIMALSNEWFSLKAHPDMKVIR